MCQRLLQAGITTRVGGEEPSPQSGINPGDTVDVSIYQTGDIEEAKVFDITANHYYGAYDTPIPDTSMFIRELSDIPTPKSARISFAQVQVNGQYLSFEPTTQYDLAGGATTLITTSPIPFNGDSFGLKFKATC